MEKDQDDGEAKEQDSAYLSTPSTTYKGRWGDLVAAIPQTALCLGGSVPNTQSEGVVAAVWDDRLRGSPCSVCGSLEREPEMLVCDRCEACAHPQCATTPVH